MSENQNFENEPEVIEPKNPMEVPTTGSEENGDPLEENPEPQEPPD